MGGPWVDAVDDRDLEKRQDCKVFNDMTFVPSFRALLISVSSDGRFRHLLFMTVATENRYVNNYVTFLLPRLGHGRWTAPKISLLLWATKSKNFRNANFSLQIFAVDDLKGFKMQLKTKRSCHKKESKERTECN